MKNTTLLLLIILFGGLVALPTLAQTIRRVNNTPGLNDPAVYPTAQAAHNAAAVGRHHLPRTFRQPRLRLFDCDKTS